MRYSPNSKTLAGKSRQTGFVLPLTLILILGVTAISVGTLYNGRTGRSSAQNYKHKIQNFIASDGLMTLLAQEMINGNASKYVDVSKYGTIEGQLWKSLPGTQVIDLRNKMAAKPSPDTLITSTHLGALMDEDNYGVKWTGWLVPPLTGLYTFYIRSDNASEFYLSSDALVSNLSATPLCFESDWAYKWQTSGNTVSKPITLVGGNRYYFEFLHKQGTEWGLGQVGWNGPENFSQRPIQGSHLSKFASDPAWGGKQTVGGLPVRYQVLSGGLDRYQLFTESVDLKKGSSNDTAFRSPLVQSLSLKGAEVIPPATIWLRAIHWDFDTPTNDEFNDGHLNTLFKGMVKPKIIDSTTTDAAYFGKKFIAKPTLHLITPTRSCGLNMWFKDWVVVNNAFAYGGGISDLTASNCMATWWDATGDKWKSVKVYDSLEFVLDVSQGPNTYVYSRMGNYDTGDPLTSWRGDAANYFPVDFRGPDGGPAGDPRNFGFCSELHTTFLHQSGLQFEFTGDDDTWIYINDSLVIDLGGVHIAFSANLNLDDMKSLKYGQVYSLDVFKCERAVFHSSFRILTNIKAPVSTGRAVSSWKRDYGSFN